MISAEADSILSGVLAALGIDWDDVGEDCDDPDDLGRDAVRDIIAADATKIIGLALDKARDEGAELAHVAHLLAPRPKASTDAFNAFEILDAAMGALGGIEGDVHDARYAGIISVIDRALDKAREEGAEAERDDRGIRDDDAREIGRGLR